jgi:hypothetical protein
MKIDKILEKLGKAQIEELDKLDEAELNKTIAEAQQAIETATEERNANERYQGAKQVIADLNGGLRNVRGFQNAKIGYALLRLKSLKDEA